MTHFQEGDLVRHNPTMLVGTVANVYGSYVVIADAQYALASDCTLLERDETCRCATADEREACRRSCDLIVE